MPRKVGTFQESFQESETQVHLYFGKPCKFYVFFVVLGCCFLRGGGVIRGGSYIFYAWDIQGC